MAWRFKASKYKNAAPIVPKPEQCVRDLSVGSYQTYGTSITASAAFMAFNIGQTGQSLCVLPLQDQGRKAKDMALLHGHSDTVTDMAFSPFHDGLLATGSQDCLLKIWCIPEGGLESSLTDPECTIPTRTQRRVETVLFHPVADCLLATSSWTVLSLWDITSQQCLYSNSTHHGEVIQCMSWRLDGQLLATTCKDKLLRVIDPRAKNDSTTAAQSTNSHQNIKDSRVIWLNDNCSLLTTGFNQTRQREICIRDTRKISSPVKSLELDSSTGILLPLYDVDTGMLFLAGKGDTSIQYMEVINREPFLVEGLRHTGDQTKGAALVPKRALNVMQAEVNRILQLTATMVVPIMYQVPRKTYRDFHADLYPETCGPNSEVTPSEWISGVNGTVKRVSLDPSKNSPDTLVQHRGSLKQLTMELDVRQQAKPTNPLLTNLHQVNQVKNKPDVNGAAAPRPKPRSSRSCSIENDDLNNLNNINNNSKPVARPRLRINSDSDKNPEKRVSGDFSQTDFTQPDQPVIQSVNPLLPVSGGYKPRLGPKPFTPPRLNSFPEQDSVDALLAIIPTNTDSNISVTSRKPNEIIRTNDIESSPIVLRKKEKNSTDEAGDENVPPKTPSLAERKKLFEDVSNKKDDMHDDNENHDDNHVDDNNDDNDGSIERNNLIRNSIAERRRMYESRSVSVVEESTKTSPMPLRRRGSTKSQKDSENNSESSSAATKRTSTVFGRVSKFRHLKGTPAHKSTHIENIRNVSRQVSGECDGFHGNCVRVAVPLSGPGGKIAVFELAKTGRLPDGVIPALVNGNNVMDFCWDPFDNSRLAAACDDGIVRIWRISEGGLLEPNNEPELRIEAHSDKIYCIKFHPLARDILATAAQDTTIRIWDLHSSYSPDEERKRITLEGHEDQILCMAWSPCGSQLATACKDGELRVFEPRKSHRMVRSGKGPLRGTRAARIVWTLDGRNIVLTGFDKVSERQIYMYDSIELTLLHTIGLDVSPSILIPFYDEDSSTLFLTGRGDTTIYTFEVTDEPPYLCPLSHHRCSTLHQGLAFVPKHACDVTQVEFARALRLTNNTIEPISFTVPRIKSELFQDDLFPPTRVTWQPSMESNEWFSGSNRQPRRFNLQPPHMQSLSSAAGAPDITIKPENIQKGPSLAAMQANFSHSSPEMMDYCKSKREQLHAAMSRKVELNLSLEQDHMDGVDENEWDE